MDKLELAKKFLAEAARLRKATEETGYESKKRQACGKGWGAVA